MMTVTEKLMEYGVPEDTAESLDCYVKDRVQTGGFLRSVLINDLFGAFAKADEENLRAMKAIVTGIYNVLPMDCWGDREVVKNWIEEGRR